jgi:hypothetical protein
MVWNGLIWLRTGASFGLLEDGKELPVSGMSGKFLDQLSGCLLLKKPSPPCNYSKTLL